MDGTPNIARVGALVGDSARAGMLSALMDGRALSAGELANAVGVTAQTASSHLAKLEQGGLLRQRKQGRHRYYALAGDEVAQLLEAMMGIVMSDEPARVKVGPANVALRHARVCYNHLAGDLGVRVYASLLDARHLRRNDDTLTLTRNGAVFFTDLGVDVPALERARAPLCLECLDWSERRSHLAGSLGRALQVSFEERGWVKRQVGTRALDITPAGKRAFARRFPMPEN